MLAGKKMVRAGGFEPFLALAPQTSGDKILTVERRRGVNEAPRFCLRFTSRFRLCTLLTLAALSAISYENVYRVFRPILFRDSRASVAVNETVHETGQNQMGIGN